MPIVGDFKISYSSKKMLYLYILFGLILSIKISVILWNKNLRRHIHELNRCMDSLIGSRDYKTNPEKQDSVKEMGTILHDYLSKK